MPDTAAKRRSAARVSRKWSGCGQTPTATPDVAWRQNSGRGYSGISVNPPIVIGLIRPAVWTAEFPAGWTAQMPPANGWTAEFD